MVIKIDYTSSDVYVSTSVSPVYVVVDYTGFTGAGFFVPYIGATTNVDLGENGLKAGQLTLDTTPTGTAVVGTTKWNDTIGGSETTLKGGNVVLKNGVDLVARVVNKVNPNTTLTKAAYQAVKISGAQGQRLAIGLAQANNDANSADTIGLVIETINANQEGFIMTMGNLEGINTTGSLQGETWADGDVLYLSPTTAGTLTNVKPNGSTGHIVVVGYVEYAHQNNGKIYVKVMNGWELDELHNVFIDNPTNNQVLTYESSTSLWKNKTPTAGTPAGSNTQIQYNNSGAFGASANLVWDNTNTRLGVGTNNPSTTLQVNGNASVENSANVARTITISNSFNGNQSSCNLVLTSDGSSGSSQVFKYASGRDAYKFISASDFGHYNGTVGGDIAFLNDFATGKIKFGAGGASTAQMTLTEAGRLLLGTTDEGTFRLDVNGSSRFKGAVNIAVNSASVLGYTITNSNSGGVSASDVVNDLGNSGFFRCYGSTFGTGTYSELSNIVGFGSSNSIKIFTDANSLSGGSNSIQFMAGGYNNDQERARIGTYGMLIGTKTSVASSILTVDSTTKGFLPPRMTTTQRDAISSPATGLQIYNTTTNENNTYNGTAWVAAGGGGTPAGSNTQIQYNNSGAFGASANLVWDNANARLGIGITTPLQSIDIETNNSSPSPYGLKIKNTNSAGRSTFFAYNDNNEGGTFGTYGTTFGASAYRNQFAIGATKGLIFGTDADLGSGGTSKMLFITGGYTNTAQMTLTAAGRLLLGTVSESTYILEVNGVPRFSGGSTAGAVFGAGTTVNLASDAYMFATSTTGKNAGYTANRFSTSEYASFDLITGASFTAGWSIQMRPSETRLDIVDRYGTENVRMSFFSGGNIGINTTTNSTFKLDVNGTARVTGNTTISSGDLNLNSILTNGAFSSNLRIGTGYSIFSQAYGSGGYQMYVTGGGAGATDFSGGFSLNFGNTTNKILSIESSQISTNQKLLLGDYAQFPGPNYQFRSYYSAPNIGFQFADGGGVQFVIRGVTANANFLTIFTNGTTAINGNSSIASAQLQVESTTRGFLPPRGTNAQMLAIASPVAGLMFYDTTNNKLNCYDGTTWQACW